MEFRSECESVTKVQYPMNSIHQYRTPIPILNRMGSHLNIDDIVPHLASTLPTTTALTVCSYRGCYYPSGLPPDLHLFPGVSYTWIGDTLPSHLVFSAAKCSSESPVVVVWMIRSSMPRVHLAPGFRGRLHHLVPRELH